MMKLVVPARPECDGRSLDAERPAVQDSKGLDDLVADVRAARPRLLDRWEATALVESLGYTDTRVQRDFGFTDTLAVGTYVFSLGCPEPARIARWVPKTESMLTIVTRSAASTLIYAVPWLTVFVAQIIRPNAMRLPSRAAPALALALMFSLIWSGGCVQAIVRRGEFYVGLRQLGLARDVVETLLRIGVAMTVGAALAGAFVAWYFELFPWPSLVLGADAFIIMSVLWMVCGTFAIRQQQWRVAAAFAAGFIAFAAARTMAADVLTAHLTAAAVVLMAATLQIRSLFSDSDGVHVRPLGVPLPQLSVLVYWTVPYFWYGTAYFAFLFADRLVAGSALAALSNLPFGVPAAYNLGMELALLTLLVAASGVEVAGALFARAIRSEAVRPVSDGARSIVAVLRRHHCRALAITFGTYVVTAIAVGSMAHRNLHEELTPLAWSTLIAGDLGYACLAIGFVNALVLFETKCPWTAVQTLTAALIINLASGYVLSHVIGTFYAVYGLLTGAAYFAASSTIAVRRTLQHADYAYALE
jgi:hypothetical protein